MLMIASSSNILKVFRKFVRAILSRILVFIISVFNLFAVMLFSKKFRRAIHKPALRISAGIHGCMLWIESMFKPSIS